MKVITLYLTDKELRKLNGKRKGNKSEHAPNLLHKKLIKQQN